jgi:flagellar biosynthesis protein FlhF
MEDALSRIKTDLGADAYILSRNKVVKPGKLNHSPVEMIEVTAAVDDVKPAPGNISPALLAKKYNYPAPDRLEKEKEQVFAKLGFTSPPASAPAPGRAAVTDKSRPLTPGMAEIKKILRGTTGFEGFKEFKGIFLDLFLDLVESGVERKIAGRLIHTLQGRTNTGNNGDPRVIREQLFNLLTSCISPPSPLKLEQGKRRIVVVIGPTGAGKTTTIAKLSSYYKLMEARKVALVTIDSYRIGAEVHLRTYADILDVPFYAVYNEREMGYRLDRLRDIDVVFVDTTGRSPNDRKGLLIMEKHLSTIPAEEKEVYLILSASTKSADLYLIYEKYSVFNPDKFIFSKIDESLSLGNLFNLKVKTDIPAAYFTTGQQVPEDIEIAYPGKFAGRVFGDYNNNAKGENP